MTKNFEVGKKKSSESNPLVADSILKREDVFVSGRERDVVKSIRMPETLSKRLKYYAFINSRTETDIFVELLKRELDLLNVRLPEEMR
jgi:hypothetical protein